MLERERRRDRRARPAERRGARAGVEPDLQPERLRRPRRTREARAAPQRRALGGAKNYPALNRAIAGVYPPGSTFKPVTALAAMEEHLISPYEALPCTATYVGENGVLLQQLEPVREHGDGRCRPRSRRRATRTSTSSACGSTSCRRARPPAAGVGEPLRVRRADRDRPRRRGRRAPADAGVARGPTFDTEIDRSGSRATRSSSRSARRTCS